MLGSKIQEKVDALVSAMATASIGKDINCDIALRPNGDALQIFTISASNGVVDSASLAIVQTFVDGLKTSADAFENAKVSYELKNTQENFSNLSNAIGNFYDA